MTEYDEQLASVVQSMSKLPNKNQCYNNLNYWNNRYTSEETYDWFTSYGSFKHIIRTTVQLSDRILMLGCGNSSLSEEMYKDGYCQIVNMDYSPVVIEKMKNHCTACSAMEWVVMDVTDMTFSKESFDVIIEKGLIDALLVNEKDPWHPSLESTVLIDNILTQISRFLKNGGRFVSITFGQPHFRRALYAKSQFQWSFTDHAIGETFHYFIYVMEKGKPLKVNNATNAGNDVCHHSIVHYSVTSTDTNEADFLYNICI